MIERPTSSNSSRHEIDGAAMGSQTYLHGKKAGQSADKGSIPSRIFKALWATRQTQDTKNNSDLLIKTTLKELIIYIVFLAVICIITFGMTNPINYYYTNVMMNLFLQTSTTNGPGVNFQGMGNMNDFWDVHQGPILDGLYWEEWYNGNASTPGFIYYENKLLGVPRLRQMRVKKGSCTVPSLFKSEIADCYDSYSYFSEEQATYGPALTATQVMSNNSAFIYQSSSTAQGAIVSGQVSIYGGGGYIANLANNKNDSATIVSNLMSNMWLDRGTRAVFLDFTIYNANINLFCQIRLISEFPATGGLLPSWSFRTVKLIRYVTPMDYFVLACEIIFVLFILYYSIEEALEIRIHKLSYFKEVWNVLDIVVILISYICIIFNIYRVVKVSQILDSLLQDSTQYPEFDSLAYWQTQFNNAIAITAFLSWIKIFKYISFNKTMTQLSSTLGRCAKDVLGFAIMFYIVFFAYAQLGYLLFGSQVPDYSSFTTTLFTLFRIILGDFDFPTLEAASRVLGPIYFLTYVFFVFFVLLNMFLAIINDTYSDVKSDISTQKSEFELGDYFKRGYDKILTKMNIKKDKIVDIQKALAAADANSDKNLNFDEWRTELRNRGYADTEIEAYFAQYDKDGDRNLTEQEQENMRKDLAQQSQKIDDDMKEFHEKTTNNPDELTKEELQLEEQTRRANRVSHQEFKILTLRVDTMETSIGNIVNKIDSVLSKLESIERAKLKRREAMAKILDKLNDANSIQDETKRAQIQRMVKEELEKWDVPLSATPSSGGYMSRAASPPSYSVGNVERKSAWLQQ